MGEYDICLFWRYRFHKSYCSVKWGKRVICKVLFFTRAETYEWNNVGKSKTPITSKWVGEARKCMPVTSVICEVKAWGLQVQGLHGLQERGEGIPFHCWTLKMSPKFFFCDVCLFGDTVSLWSPGCPRTQSLDQTGPVVTEICLPLPLIPSASIKSLPVPPCPACSLRASLVSQQLSVLMGIWET